MAHDYHLQDWLDGWQEAKEFFFEKEEKEKESETICKHCGAIIKD